LTEVRWSPEAADDLERICDRIERENPAAARRVAEIIYERCGALGEFPNRGRTGRIGGTRELVFTPLEIARIYHSAQDWP
jgi:toxin ParE1/3/4